MSSATSPRLCTNCGGRLSQYNSESLCAACSRNSVDASRRQTPPSALHPQETWLYTKNVAPAPPDGSNIGELLRAYRDAQNLNQGELAALLGYDQSYVSLIERGKRPIRDINELRRVAAELNLPEDELGLLPVPRTSQQQGEVVAGEPGKGDASDAVAVSQRNWRLVRRLLNQNRHGLSVAAKNLYPSYDGVRGVLSKPSWLSDRPVPIEDVSLAWLGQLDQPSIVGSEPQAEDMRPLASADTHFERYSRAIRAIERPRLFENRVSFRLAESEWDASGGRLGFGYTTYFDMVDVCEAAAHEMAAAWLASNQSADWLARPTWSRLPFRSMLGDPFNLTQRSLLPSIDTLTIRLDRGEASFLLHRRDSASVAVAGGFYHIMPAGVFQPSSLAPWDQANDFDLWRNMMREYSEEFLGLDEADGSSGEPIDYEGTEPFRSMNAARQDGSLRAYYFGIGLDPLTLAGEILSVVVIEAEAYDRIFRDLVTMNTEGSVVSSSPTSAVGIPFTEENVRRLLNQEPIAPAAAACLDLAWRHREFLVG
jgi:transcriptional regulator with XRE-family HTH domain